MAGPGTTPWGAHCFSTTHWGREILTPPLLPAAVTSTTPDDPTAYSDGAFTNPTQPVYGLATAAVWWPGRVSPPTALEHDYAWCEVRSLGRAFLGYLGGFSSSSSRIELLGTILAVFSDQPLHLAVDNASVVKRAAIYQDWLLHRPEEPPPGKPLGLTKKWRPLANLLWCLTFPRPFVL